MSEETQEPTSETQADQEPTSSQIHVDDDWKAQAQAEKEKLEEEMISKYETPPLDMIG